MVEMPSERSFGLFFALIFFAIALLPLAHGQKANLHGLITCCVLLFISLFIPKFLKPFNYIWFRFGLLLHSIIGPVTLFFLFFGVFTPYGFLMRRFGRLSLVMHFDRNAKTYWIDRVPSGPAPESFTRQF